jgi:predicted nucleic acid-binding protein
MILYLDTSALVKRYFLEPYSDDVISGWKSATQIVTSFVAYAEMIASIYRKKREAGLADKLIRKIASEFHRDWESFIRVEDISIKWLKNILLEASTRSISRQQCLSMKGFRKIFYLPVSTTSSSVPRDLKGLRRSH